MVTLPLFCLVVLGKRTSDGGCPPSLANKKRLNGLALSDVAASGILASTDAAKDRARRASHVQRAWSGSCAVRIPRSVITSHARVALIVDQRNLDDLLAENCGDLAQLGY